MDTSIQYRWQYCKSRLLARGVTGRGEQVQDEVTRDGHLRSCSSQQRLRGAYKMRLTAMATSGLSTQGVMGRRRLDTQQPGCVTDSLE